MSSDGLLYVVYSLTENQLTFSEMFDDLPVTVRNSALATAFMNAQTPRVPQASSPASSNPTLLSLPSRTTHTRALESLIDSLEALRSE